ncbi:hypothetical protein ACFYMO_21910 [Streptomyces sp. NPDC007025]|uniref:hypothetical protein n=1 Tax=Streptomyces sp. NPDC007025 TaxID=3364771 RepID=UPI0036CC4493
MSAHDSPRLKSIPTTDRPSTAEPAAAPGGRGAPKNAARQGALSALRPDPHLSNMRHPVAWLTITAPGRGAIPTGTSWCACGRDRSAVGHRQVAALAEAHAAHRTTCPLRAPQEGRTAA